MSKRRVASKASKSVLRFWLVGVLGLIAAAAVVLVWRAAASRPEVAAVALAPSRGSVIPAVARRETRPTLDTALFVGRARRAHEIAREIPDPWPRCRSSSPWRASCFSTSIWGCATGCEEVIA